MTPIIFYLGPRDLEYGRFSGIRKTDKPGINQVAMRGCLPLSDLYTKDEENKDNSTVIIGGYHKKNELRNTTPVNLFNQVGDAESSTAALEGAELLANAKNIGRVFNHPRDIRKTTRDNAAALFADIPRLIVPKLQVLESAEPAELDALQLDFPVIIRIAGEHSGEAMHLVHKREELQQRVAELGTEKRLLLIQYFDTRNKLGLFQKIRLVFVDGVCYPRHYILAEDWCIHAGNRQDHMLQSESARQEEREFMEHFESRIADYLPSLQEMNRRIGLDVWGMDCAILPSGEIVLYEANACMNILPQRAGPNQEFAYLLPVVEAIRSAIKMMIVES
jgi:glutathione synthase/RimK-type ligase-like ATP-grasp enzyme